MEHRGFIEFWCSPERGEVYERHDIWMCQGYEPSVDDIPDEELIEQAFSHGLGWVTKPRGLFKVVVEVKIVYTATVDHEGIPDGETDLWMTVRYRERLPGLQNVRDKMLDWWPERFTTAMPDGQWKLRFKPGGRRLLTPQADGTFLNRWV